MNPLLIVSPHLDDAVLSNGQLIAGRGGVVVVTVFAGRPVGRSAAAVKTDYDLRSGWNNAREAVFGRRQEDSDALDLLGAQPMWLSWADNQYDSARDTPEALAASLAAVVADVKPDHVLMPLGLVHADHLFVADACRLLPRPLAPEWWVYEDVPSRVLWPENVPGALDSWRAAGWRPELGFLGTGPLDTKRAAIRLYRSQMWALDVEHTCLVPERHWRLWPSDV